MFRPEKFFSTANFSNPKSFTEGIDLTIINGKIAWESGAVVPARSGKILNWI
jgi:hypothetical protein